MPKHKPPTRDVFVKLFVLFAPTPYQRLFLINATTPVSQPWTTPRVSLAGSVAYGSGCDIFTDSFPFFASYFVYFFLFGS